MKDPLEKLLYAIEIAQARLDSARVEERECRTHRDQLIQEARRHGLTLRAVADAANLHHTAVAKIEKREAR